MTRGRQPKDWERDVRAARKAEQVFYEQLRHDERLNDLQDLTDSFDSLDFSFTWEGTSVNVDLKEKRQSYSQWYQELWPDVRRSDLFILDETVYRRIIWQGGGGYLVVHDHPESRWVIFGPWELTLGPRKRFQRWGQRSAQAFAKGKLLLDLSAGACTRSSFSVDDLLDTIGRTIRERDAVEAVAYRNLQLPEVGGR